MSTRRQVSSQLSLAVVEWLVNERGLTQDQIAEMLEVTPGFISRVRSRERGLTLEHLERIAAELETPLGALLMTVSPLDRLDAAHADLGRIARSILLNGDKARAAMKRRSSHLPA